jgi:hypothetical protein
MSQAVSHQPLTTVAQVRARFNQCDNCGEQNGTGTGFSPRFSGFPCQYLSPKHIYHRGMNNRTICNRSSKIYLFIGGLCNDVFSNNSA